MLCESRVCSQYNFWLAGPNETGPYDIAGPGTQAITRFLKARNDPIGRPLMR
jgi:hypothetical protein